ncbi:hypothetical protein FQN54_000703 [Arachnomyces sp. PD_36]|nr:hypothetical protein FQN54_000703 [Arachnomyces sp. PD_36]
MADTPSEAMANTQSDNPADHAATAALYVTNSGRRRPTSDLVDKRKKLQFADGLDPMHPSSTAEMNAYPPGGLDLASAGAAASLAHANYKPVEPWRPKGQHAAGKAALLAHRHPPESISSEPAPSTATVPKTGKPGPSYLAAEKVMSETGHGPNGSTPARFKGAHLAATGAMSGNLRKSPGMAPDESEELQTRASHAMSAAVKSHRMSQASGVVQEERDTSHSQDTTHAAALHLARQMYAGTADLDGVRSPTSGSVGRQVSTGSHPRVSSQPGLSTISEPSPYNYPSHLQDHAQRLAAQRMSSMYDENKAYRDYYGISSRSNSRSRMADRFRRRSSSDSEASKTDRERSRKIRSEMSQFRTRLDEVDSQREKDRASLLAAAKRNVELEMQRLDEVICADTGRPSPAMVRAWEAKLKERRASEGSGRIDTTGKVVVGGGRYVDRDDIHSLAKERLQPTFDDLKDRAEADRARLTEERLDEEERQRMASIEKEREADLKEEQKKMKDYQKQREKEEKAEKAEKQRQEKEEHRLWKRRSRESKGKDRASEGSESPRASTAASHEAETSTVEEDRKSHGILGGFYQRPKEEAPKVKYAEPSRTQPSTVQEQESSRPVQKQQEYYKPKEEAPKKKGRESPVTKPSPTREQERTRPVQARQEPSPTQFDTRSDAERIYDWVKAKRRRSSADKTSSFEASKAPRAKEEEAALSGARTDNYVIQKPVMGAAAVSPTNGPSTAEAGTEAAPGHATALRSHPVTNGDMPQGETTGATQGTEAVREQPSGVRETKSAEESGAGAQNRRSKRWSLKGILGRNGKNGGEEEPEGLTRAVTEQGADTTTQEQPKIIGTRAGEAAVRDSRFVENL